MYFQARTATTLPGLIGVSGSSAAHQVPAVRRPVFCALRCRREGGQYDNRTDSQVFPSPPLIMCRSPAVRASAGDL